MEGVSNAAWGGGGAVQTIPGWGGSHPECWSCRDGLQLSCWLLGFGPSGLQGGCSRSNPEEFEGGFPWLPVGLGLRLIPSSEPHTAPSPSGWDEPEQPRWA